MRAKSSSTGMVERLVGGYGMTTVEISDRIEALMKDPVLSVWLDDIEMTGTARLDQLDVPNVMEYDRGVVVGKSLFARRLRHHFGAFLEQLSSELVEYTRR